MPGDDQIPRSEDRALPSHGNTPAAWTAVAVALVGFVVGGIGLMLEPISYPVFWVGVGIVVVAIIAFAVMSKLGFAEAHEHD